MLPTMGGQTALNIATALSKNGTLKKYKVELIGANLKAINNPEKFWRKQAELVKWYEFPETILSKDENGFYRWFKGEHGSWREI